MTHEELRLRRERMGMKFWDPSEAVREPDDIGWPKWVNGVGVPPHTFVEYRGYGFPFTTMYTTRAQALAAGADTDPLFIPSRAGAPIQAKFTLPTNIIWSNFLLTSVVMAALTMIPFAWRAARGAVRRDAGLCEHCGYDRISLSGVCPECGRELPPEKFPLPPDSDQLEAGS